MSFQSLEGYVLYVMPSSSCFNLAVCSCLISSAISVFCTLILSRISGVCTSMRSWACFFSSFCLMLLLKHSLKCLIVPVGIFFSFLRQWLFCYSVVLPGRCYCSLQGWMFVVVVLLWQLKRASWIACSQCSFFWVCVVMVCLVTLVVSVMCILRRSE